MRSTDAIGLGGSVRLLLTYIAPKRRTFYVVMLLSLLDAALSAQISLSFKYLIDGAVTQRSGKVLAAIMIGLSVSILVVGAAGIWRDRLYGRTAAQLSSAMRTKMFLHMQKLSANFYSRMEAADIVSRFANDLTEVEAAFVSAVPCAILPALDILFSIVLIVMLDWRLAIPALAAFPIAMAGPRWLSSKTSAAAYERKKCEAQIVASIQENVSAHALLRAFNLENFARGNFDSHNRTLERTVSRLGYLTLLMERSGGFATQLLQVAVLGCGGYLTFRGQISIGTLAAFQALFGTLAESLGYISEYLPNIVRASGGMIRIEELLAQQPMVIGGQTTIDLPGFRDCIEFSNVAFSYESGHRSLNGVSLRIARGTSVALVGSSGSGKSTTLNMLLRFYDPTQGAVLIDGHDLRTLSHDSLSSMMAMVFQENVLLNATIRQNIGIARPQATDAEIEQAARKAGLHEFITNLQDGYNTTLSAADGRFAAGQRQRVAIARALLRDPEILILDEATSALDSGSEAEINDALRQAAQGRTVISATHRLASITAADRIFLLDKGAVVEEGTHAELLEKDGTYARMWRKQSGFVVAANGAQMQTTPQWLRGVPILSQLDEDVLKKLSTMFTTERCSKGDFIIREGAVGEKFYILVRGIAEALKPVPSGYHRLAVFQDGDHFGETSLILNAPRNASVRALADCTLLVLDRGRFQALIEKAPSLRWKLREDASIAAFRTEAEQARTTDGLRDDLLNWINQIAGYSDIVAEDLEESGYGDRVALARRVRALAAEVQAGVERAIPSGEVVSDRRLDALRRETDASVSQLNEAASELRAATSGSEFAGVHSDVARIVAACLQIGAAESPGTLVEDTDIVPRRSPAPADPSGRAWHLLVVDNNDSGRGLLCYELERQGYRTSASATGTEALQRIKNEEFDLVLLDVMMPDLDGFAVLEKLQQIGKLDTLTVIITTAIDDVTSIARCLAMGAEGYLIKPYDPMLLRARLAAALERKRARDQDRSELQQTRAALEAALNDRRGTSIASA